MGYCHMIITGKYGYKTGTFIIKKKFFSNLFIALNIVYMYIYDVPQWSSCHWELISWPFDWDLVSYFHILAEAPAKAKKRGFAFFFFFFFFLNGSNSQSKFGLEISYQWYLLHWGTGRYLMNWIQVVSLFLEVGESPVFPLASRLLTHGRSRDCPSTPLDHYLTLGQQVVFQSLELKEVPISPQRLSSCSCQQVNHQRETQALTQVGWPRACNRQHPHSDALCIPRSYLHDNHAHNMITT